MSRSLARRGWLAHFIITNKGQKRTSFDIGGLETKLIPAGKKGKLGVVPR